MTIWVYPLPKDMSERHDYSVFPQHLETDWLVLFHGTKLANLMPIRYDGFRRGIDVGGQLPSVSYGMKSAVALDHWISHRHPRDYGVIIAVRFESLDGFDVRVDTVYDRRPIPTQPKIVGYCVVPGSCVHR